MSTKKKLDRRYENRKETPTKIRKTNQIKVTYHIMATEIPRYEKNNLVTGKKQKKNLIFKLQALRNNTNKTYHTMTMKTPRCENKFFQNEETKQKIPNLQPLEEEPNLSMMKLQHKQCFTYTPPKLIPQSIQPVHYVHPAQ